MLEFLDRILNAETADDVWALQTDAIESFGFDRLIYGFTRYMTETGFGCPDDCLILSNHEPEYVQRYIGDGLYAHAPMLHWAAFVQFLADAPGHSKTPLQSCPFSHSVL